MRVLADSKVQEDTEVHWDFRLRRLILFPKAAEAPVGLWELVAPKGAKRRTSQTEWMYELSAVPSNAWSACSRAVALWCKGDTEQALAALAAQSSPVLESSGVYPGSEVEEPSTPATSQAVFEANNALAAAIHSGAAPPIGPVPAAAGVGHPSPAAQGGRAQSVRSAWPAAHEDGESAAPGRVSPPPDRPAVPRPSSTAPSGAVQQEPALPARRPA
eukprot:TRINITY_DN6571_c0_g4_i1.p2 TRINITY_DN6571_c0_g4~~TRINITY_DN6571_c0_g4_i1.p2  ORF type:complete len:216 (+),score=29.22 TRINITY_DN6571_c0_g4_i1:1655-2302(+)